MTVSVLLVVDDRPDNLLVSDQSRVRSLLLPDRGPWRLFRPLSRALAGPGPSSRLAKPAIGGHLGPMIPFTRRFTHAVRRIIFPIN
jgi:hypothetical protein